MQQSCPQCGRPTDKEHIYCIQCGAKLQTLCPNCATPNLPESSFCQRCGTAIIAGSRPSGAAEEVGRPASSQSEQSWHRYEAPPPPSHEEPSSYGYQERTAPLVCPRCNNVNESESAFCFSCGLPIDESWDASPAAGEYGRPAGFWIRLVAHIIDQIILFVTYTVIFLIVVAVVDPAFYGVNEPVRDPSSGAESLYYLFSLLTAMSYYTFTVSFWSATLGKRAVGIRVLRPDGTKLSFWRAFARYWASILSALLLLIGYLMIAFREDKRGLHDGMCDTVVVFKR